MRWMIFIISCCALLPAQYVSAACSPYLGQASFNEFFKDRTNQASDPDDFVELKILNGAITSTIFDTWTIQICERNNPGNNNDADGCSGAVSVSTFTDKTPAWIVLQGSIGNYINFKTGFDAILRDGSGGVIDYLSVDGYKPLEDSSCTGTSLPFDYQASAPGASDKFIFRSPDGTGDWGSATSASAPPTENDTNDQDPSGNPAPYINVANVTVFKGDTASFSFTLPAGAVAYDVSVHYQTLNATAIAGTDYTATSGTATITAGNTSTYVNVLTNAASTSGQVYFYLYLSNPVNATPTNHYPSGTILANPLAAWEMEQTSWTGSSAEVIDVTGNGYDGTAVNGPDTEGTLSAITGSPGTCRYGVFDGNNDYVALPGFPNLTTSFTITAWIKPNVINKDQRIFADDQNNSGGYAFSLGDPGNGRLRFFSRNVSPVSLDSGVVISAGSWYHVAVVHNVTNKTRQIFVNGVAVTTAQTYTGTWGSDAGTAAIGGETNGAGSEATSNWRFNGSIDEVRVYNNALDSTAITNIKNLTRPCTAALHHIEIQHDGSGLTCEPENITLRACINSSCSGIYASNVTVDLSPSGWVSGSTQTIVGGQSTFQFRHTTAGSVTYAINNTLPAATSAYTCLNTSNSSTSCAQTFYDTGFIYTIPTQTACNTSTPITMSAVRLDVTSQACVPTFVGQTRNIDFSLNYANPTTGTQSLTLDYAGTAYTPINNLTAQTVPVTFDSAGQANFTLAYPDAGQVTLNSLYTGTIANNDEGLSMSGAASFVSKPYKLLVFADEPNNDCAGSLATCSAFKRAGEAFNLKVRAACSDDTVTPNFQLDGLTLTHTNTAPAISQGVLGVSNFNVQAADLGEHLITQTVSEVGAYTFSAGLPVAGYFGETIGDATLNTSTEIGRFYPDHFCLTSNSLLNRTDSYTASGCSDVFSYLDEQFEVRFALKAQAMGSVCSSTELTQNYSGTWSQFSSPFVDDATNANELGKWNLGALQDPAGAATDLRARITIDTGASSPSAGSFTNGEINVTTVLDINRQGSAPGYTAEAELNDVHLAINPLDLDSVALDTTSMTIGTDTYRDVGNTTLYFGRLFAENAFGTNASDIGLDMYARTEYCHAITAGICTDWQSNVGDSCSLYNITPPAGTALGLAAGNDGQGYYQRASAATTSSIFNFDDPGSAPSYSRVHVPDTNNHSAGWRLFCDGCGDGGSYTIPFSFPFNSPSTVHPYLLHVDGVATFGQFRGDDRIIYWREILK